MKIQAQIELTKTSEILYVHKATLPPVKLSPKMVKENQILVVSEKEVHVKSFLKWLQRSRRRLLHHQHKIRKQKKQKKIVKT
jgi:hypothetical protein